MAKETEKQTIMNAKKKKLYFDHYTVVASVAGRETGNIMVMQSAAFFTGQTASLVNRDSK
jgi:hypothetical protein